MWLVARQPRDEGDENQLRLNVPAWLTAIGKGGPWVLLTAVLVYTYIIRGQEQDSVTARNVAANGEAIQKIGEAMSNAGSTMHAYVLDAQRQNREELVLMLEICVQQAEALKTRDGTQRCFNAARGLNTRQEK